MEWTLAIDRALPRPIRLILKGISQVFFMNNSVTGLILLIGIFVGSWVSGVAALVGTICSTYTAVVLKFPEDSLDAGLFGFNGSLTGIALLIFLEKSPMLWVYVVLASITSTIITAALMSILDKWQIPSSTAPFISVTWIFLLAVFSFSNLSRGEALPLQQLPQFASSPVYLSVGTGIIGMLKSIAEVIFQDSIITGCLFIIGIAVASKWGAILAVFGAFLGVIVPALLGADQHLIEMGLYGFNPVLTLMAVGLIFIRPSVKTTIMAILAGIVTVVVQGAISNFLAPVGLPVLTSPYIATMWMFTFAAKTSKLG